MDQQQGNPDPWPEALLAQLVKSEALRAAELGSGGQEASLEAVLARISAQVTADASQRRSVAERKDSGPPGGA